MTVAKEDIAVLPWALPTLKSGRSGRGGQGGWNNVSVPFTLFLNQPFRIIQ